MRFFAMTVFAAGALSACQSPRTSQPVVPAVESTPYNLSPAMVEKVKSAVIRDLKDPDSARFNSKFVAAKTEKSITICGFVNAKNSFGGYTGDKPFLVVNTGDLYSAVAVGGTEIETASTMAVCRADGAEPVR